MYPPSFWSFKWQLLWGSEFVKKEREKLASSPLNNFQERLQYSQLTHCVQQVLVEQGSLAEQVMTNQKA